MKRHPSPNRVARVVRGGVATTAATLLAAASHAFGGGAITWLAVVATIVLALPLGVALAGRLGSLWRLAVTVSAAQFLFHWSFAGIGGVGAPAAAGSTPAPLHVHQLVASFTLGTAVPGSVAAMWSAHALTAILTIALLHRGEQAILSLLRLALRALPADAPRPTRLPAPALLPALREALPLSGRFLAAGPISHRGPPAFS